MCHTLSSTGRDRRVALSEVVERVKKIFQGWMLKDKVHFQATRTTMIKSVSSLTLQTTCLPLPFPKVDQ